MFPSLDVSMTKAYQDNRIHWIRIMRNWLHQGLTYMDKGERRARLAAEAIEFLIVFSALSAFHWSGSAELVSSALFAGLIVHTWNWVTNANFWALMLFSIPGLSNHGEPEIRAYLNNLAQRVGRSASVRAVFLIGSSARGEWHQKSDIDIRFLRKPGVRALIGSWCVLTIERFRAFLALQPLDLFLLDNWPRDDTRGFREDPVCIFGDLPNES
jgi:hypothetical protein